MGWIESLIFDLCVTLGYLEITSLFTQSTGKNVPVFFNWSSYGSIQWSSTFWAPETDSREDNVSLDWAGRVASGWFRCVTLIVHFFAFVHFISNLMLPLIWWKVPVHSPDLGHPCVSDKVEDGCWPIRHPYLNRVICLQFHDTLWFCGSKEAIKTLVWRVTAGHLCRGS